MHAHHWMANRKLMQLLLRFFCLYYLFWFVTYCFVWEFFSYCFFAFILWFLIFYFFYFYYLLCLYVLSFASFLCLFLWFVCFLIACLLSKERQERERRCSFEWIGRWEGSGRKWRRRSYDHDILYEFLIHIFQSSNSKPSIGKKVL